MGNRRRAKDIVISNGSLCFVRNFYETDLDPDPVLGIIIDLISQHKDYLLYAVLVDDSIVERNDLEVELIQDLQQDAQK